MCQTPPFEASGGGGGDVFRPPGSAPDTRTTNDFFDKNKRNFFFGTLSMVKLVRMVSISKYRGATRYRYRTFKVSTDGRPEQMILRDIISRRMSDAQRSEQKFLWETIPCRPRNSSKFIEQNFATEFESWYRNYFCGSKFTGFRAAAANTRELFRQRASPNIL